MTLSRFGVNELYVAPLRAQWASDPSSVSDEWQREFENERALEGPPPGQPSSSREELESAMLVAQLVHTFRVRGFLIARTDPLGEPRQHPDLALEGSGLTARHLERPFPTLGLLEAPFAPLRELLSRVQEIYCGSLAVEFMHLADSTQRRFMQERAEQPVQPLSPGERRRVLETLTRAQGLERFLHTRYLGQKRFSIEGAESAVVMLLEALDVAAAQGVQQVVIGMAHRGRLNVLAHVVHRPLEEIFAVFEDREPATGAGPDDVKVHLGARGRHGALDVELSYNPSHLEAVDPVVLGMVRARQDQLDDAERRQVLPLLVHGDAAFAGQGVVYETLQLSGVPGWRVGGTVHLIINNQIGFTTPPEEARTSLHCSDVARAIQAPVLRVNGDDPDACVRAVRWAMDYRSRFARDVVMELVCYRRWGHNESDEPAFTQPQRTKFIERHRTTLDRYADLLVQSGALRTQDVEAIDRDARAEFERAFEAARANAAPPVAAVDPTESAPHSAHHLDEEVAPVSRELLLRVAERITTVPAGFTVHPRLLPQVVERRQRMVNPGKGGGGPGIDFGMAEALALGSLLEEGVDVRLTGQDVSRGTFSHRHARWVDHESGRSWIPLAKTPSDPPRRGRFSVYDSILSEEGVLGFEYGYSVAHKNALVLWEAQFGDFLNGAQIQVDQFVAAGEAKWAQHSSLTLLLPHGYDGQGPEHSSARLERLLQLCAGVGRDGEDADGNLRVCVASSAAQYFHLLRRQALSAPKPLAVLTHKSLLRFEEACAALDELTGGRFEPVLADPRRSTALPRRQRPRRLVLCAGKVYWDLDRARAQRADADALEVVRLEELHPFPAAAVRAALERAGCDDVVWLQEEPRNMGAWGYLEPRLRELGADVRLVARPDAASPATGSARRHQREQLELIDACFAASRLPRQGAVSGRLAVR